jgi:hypothetical protein
VKSEARLLNEQVQAATLDSLPGAVPVGVPVCVGGFG